MAVPAILAGIGRVMMGAVTGTAKGLSMGVKSSGPLRMSATTVKSNIINSNKKLRRIKLNRRRISRSIFNEQKRQKREKKLESRSKSNKKGLLSSPLSAFGGIQKFITTILFGMAISNIENIKKFFDNIGEGISNFGKMIQSWYDNTVYVLTLGLIDGQKLRKDRADADKEVDKLKFALDTLNIDSINKFSHKVGSGWYMKPKTLKDITSDKNTVGTGLGAKGALGPNPLIDPHMFQAIIQIATNRDAIANENRKKRLMGDKYEGPLNNLYTGPVVERRNTWIGAGGALNILDPHYWEFMFGGGVFYFGDKKIGNMKAYKKWLKSSEGKNYLKNIEGNRLDNLMNSNGAAGSSENTVIINQPIIKKVYVPVGG